MRQLTKTAQLIRKEYSTQTKVAFTPGISRALGSFGSKGVPLFSDYARNLKNLLVDPVRQKGILPGVWDYTKALLVPTKYSTGLTSKAKGFTDQIAELQASLAKATDPVVATKLQEQIGKLVPQEQAVLKQLKDIEAAGGDLGYYKNLMAESISPTTPGTRMSNLWKLTKATGHNLGEGVNMGFTYGAPALGIYEASQAPAGDRMGTLGRVIGENAGFFGMGRLGILPAIGGSVAGGKAGKALFGGLQSEKLPKFDMGLGITPQAQQAMPQAMPQMPMNYPYGA